MHLMRRLSNIRTFLFHAAEPPAPPTTLKATRIESNSVQLAWSAGQEEEAEQQQHQQREAEAVEEASPDVTSQKVGRKNVGKGGQETPQSLPIKNFLIEIAPRNGENTREGEKVSMLEVKSITPKKSAV